MKTLYLSIAIALTAAVSSNAQTLQVDPIYVGGAAAFEVQNATPGAIATDGHWHIQSRHALARQGHLDFVHGVASL